MDKWLTLPRVLIWYVLLPVIAVIPDIVDVPAYRDGIIASVRYGYLSLFPEILMESVIIAVIIGWYCAHKWGKKFFFRIFNLTFLTTCYVLFFTDAAWLLMWRAQW